MLPRPGAGTRVAPGGRVNGIGWIVCDAAVTAVEIHLGGKTLGRARLGLSRDDLEKLIGQAPEAAATGFVFAVAAPDLPPGPAILRLRVRTASSHHDHDVALVVAAAEAAAPPAPVPAPAMAGKKPEPVRAMIDVARVDARGILHVAGWAASLSPIESMKIFLGARALGAPQGGLRRDDVAAMLPDHDNAATSGFLLTREVTEADLAAAEIRLVVAARGGIRRVFFAPLARPDRPLRRAAESVAMVACEEVGLTESGDLFVKGWAVASSGVVGIDIELDEVLAGTAMPDEERPDVGNRFARIAGAHHSGFRFSRRLERRFSGDHVVRLTVRGRAGEENSCFSAVATSPAAPRKNVPVAAPARAGAPDPDAIKFFLDAPACKDGMAIETVRGFLTLNGWAFGRDGIDRIDVFVDGIAQGRAHHGIRREDLRASFPGHDTLRAGFAMLLPPQVMKPGTHAVRIDIHDKAGRVKQIGFSVRAAPASSGPGPWMPREKIPRAEIDLSHAVLAARGRAPRWRVLLLLDDTSDAALASLAATLKSLRWQAYENWSCRLVVPDDESRARLDVSLRAEHGDVSPGRIAIFAARPERALAELAGEENEFLMVLAPGDRLGEDALLELSVFSALAPGTDFLYGDERRIDPADGVEKAFFKPDFSPDLLLSTNYIGRPFAVSLPLLARVGLSEADLRRHGAYDAVLRLTEAATKIGHVQKVLLSRGRHGDSNAVERRALRRALRRRNIAASLLAGPVPGTWRARREIGRAARGAMVSIIIPTNFSRDLIKTAIRSIRARTAWPSYEIIVLDTTAGDDATRATQKAWLAKHADRVVAAGAGQKFNWSRLNNSGARVARGQFLLFLNDDIEVLEPDWLHGLIEHAQRPEIGVVGPRLLYPDGRVQHAGVFLARRAGRHAFRFYPRDEPGPFGLALTQRDVISVTGACMMIRREVFHALGGFETAHAVVNNDLDFSLRARARGFAVVYTPAVTLIHHEMVSRAALADTYNSARFERDWGDLFRAGDPFFSPHFSPDHDDFLPDAEPVRVFAAGHPLFSRGGIKKILAVKVDHIGDFISVFPALRRLKEIFPGAELTVLCAKASVALAGLEPAIDRVERFDFYHARSEKGRRAVGRGEMAALRARLGGKEFDLAIDFRRQPDTRELLHASGARWLAGFDTGGHHPWLDIAVEFEGDYARRWKRQHVTESLLALAEAIGGQCADDRAILRDPPSRAAARAAFLAARPELGDKKIVCVHAGAGALNKQWPADSFAGLIDLLLGMGGVAVALVGGPGEAVFSAGVIKRARRGGDIINLVGRTNLRDLPGVLAAADCFLGNDSGPKHIAAALGVPTIGIHSGSVDAGEWGAVGPRALTIRRDMVCAPCYLARAEDCHRGLACLGGIGVAEVFDACRRMLALAG